MAVKMLGFLKKKLKNAVEEVKKKVGSETPEEVKPKISKKAPKISKKPVSKKQVRKEVIEEETQKLGFRERVKQRFIKKISASEFEEIFFEFEMALLENNVAQEVVEKLKLDMKKEFVGEETKKRRTLEKVILDSFDEILIEGKFKIPTKKPFVCMFIGVNGVGKTKSMAKLAYYLQKKKKKFVFAASDTFRAASIEQLEKHGNKLKIKVIKHSYGADAAAVSFDAINYAKKHNLNFVLIDTAGRMHSNKNLMDELKKIKRVSNPDFVFFVADSLTGNDAVNQAKTFNEEIGFDGIILTKSDVDQKGGAIISVSYVTGKPIYFLGMGQNYKDLKPFKKQEILNKII